MLYYNTANREKFTEAVKSEARNLGVDLVVYDLDVRHEYRTADFLNLEKFTEKVLGDIRGWFPCGKFNKKELNIAVCVVPWEGEFVCIQTRCKR